MTHASAEVKVVLLVQTQNTAATQSANIFFSETNTHHRSTMHSKLSLNGYSMFLGLQLALVLFDLFVNSYSFALVDRRLEWLGLFYV